jgi:hypothetical protein
MECALPVVNAYSYGIIQENKLSVKLNDKLLFKGVETTAGSGNQFYVKEDLIGDKIIAQVKSTKSSVYPFKPIDFKKLEVHAYKADKIPVFIVNFSKYKKQIFFIAETYRENIKEYLYETPGHFLGLAKVWASTVYRTYHVINNVKYLGYFFEDFR